MKTPEKRAYSPPQLTEYGEVKDLTKGARAGAALDSTFPAGTPVSDLTFS